MRYRRPYVFLICSVFLAGCASKVADKGNGADAAVDRHILDAARKIELAQTHLYRAVGTNETPGSAPAAIAGAGDRRTVTVAWKGDAGQLIRRLAEDRGLQFMQMGVRTPLPVSIDVNGEALPLVLDRIRAQVGYRAVVDEKSGALVLLYNRPSP